MACRISAVLKSLDRFSPRLHAPQLRRLCTEVHPSTPLGSSHAVIALGGNVGDSVDMLQSAIRSLAAHGINVLRTSNLYKTQPMHVLQQPSFINAAALVSTTLAPLDLLATLKQIEEAAGRDLRGMRWGPRPLDLDIIFYNSAPFDHPALTIPHPRWHERDFVKVPIADLLRSWQADSKLQVAPWLEQVRQEYLTRPPYSDDVMPIFPLAPHRHHVVGSRTLVMGILNVTPDSFSDGGAHNGLEEAVSHARSMVASGADIIDVGGQSTRPGATVISAEEEAARIIPVIKRLCSIPDCVVSVDTYYASVAEASVAVGAHIVNDVSAGARDPAMFSTVARLGVPYIMMHMRGNEATMQSAANTRYADLPIDVGAELQASVDAAGAAGIESWRIMLDPGVGFSKTARDNCRLIAGLPRLRLHGLLGGMQRAPVLVGASRKGFLGRLSGRKEVADRDIATAAAVALSISYGADVVRVHNVAACLDAVRVADAVHRDWWPDEC